MLEGSGIPSIVIKSSSILDLQSEELKNVGVPTRKPVVAIYPNSFADHTGQRKSNGQFALFSTAITQAPEAFLIRALKHSGNGKFWRVVERVGLDSLTKERQIIRSTRVDFEDQSEVKPLLFAGLLLQGGVLSYDQNVLSGGSGARYLGIGSSKQYREDLMTVSLKACFSQYRRDINRNFCAKKPFKCWNLTRYFSILDEGQRLVEVEGGRAQNESTSIVLQSVVERAVLEIIKIGETKGYWEIRDEEVN